MYIVANPLKIRKILTLEVITETQHLENRAANIIAILSMLFSNYFLPYSTDSTVSLPRFLRKAHSFTVLSVEAVAQLLRGQPGAVIQLAPSTACSCP